MFIQLHTLTSYPASLLNRDDAGFAKTIPFGGATRTRVSSQCLKKHWRDQTGPNGLADLGNASIRSRHLFKERVARPLIEEGLTPHAVMSATYAISEYATSEKLPTITSLKGKVKAIAEANTLEDKLSELQQDQVTVFGEAEANYLQRLVKEAVENVPEDVIDDPDKAARAVRDYLNDKTIKASVAAAAASMGVDAAIFGRMVTSDVAAQGHAAIHVAHAMTTHASQNESDYLTAVDTIDSQGAGTLQSIQLTSGVFYSYFAIDAPLLVRNLEGLTQNDDWQDADLTLAKDVIARTIRAATMSSPGAKLGSTAPYSYAGFVLSEIGTAQPCQLANAFLNPVSLENQNLMKDSTKAIVSEVQSIDHMYAPGNQRFVSYRQDISSHVDAEQTTVDELAISTAEAIN